jgi:Flp pilus assembly CpaE family ATPase
MTLQMGMLVTHLNVEPKYTLADLLTYQLELDMHMVEKALTRFSDSLFVLADPERPVSQTPDLPMKLASVIDSLRTLADFVVLDAPCTFDDSYFDILNVSNKVILVAEQRIPAIRNAQVVLEALGCNRNPANHHLVLNRYDAGLTGFTSSDIAKLLHLPRVMTLTNDPMRVTAALNQGQPLRLAVPKTPLLSDIQNFMRTVLDPALIPSTKADNRKLFGRLRHAIGLT